MLALGSDTRRTGPLLQAASSRAAAVARKRNDDQCRRMPGPLLHGRTSKIPRRMGARRSRMPARSSGGGRDWSRSEEHTYELHLLMRISDAEFCFNTNTL